MRSRLRLLLLLLVRWLVREVGEGAKGPTAAAAAITDIIPSGIAIVRSSSYSGGPNPAIAAAAAVELGDV